MSNHDYLVPIMAIAFMIINLCGAVFTISRVYSKRMQQRRGPSPAAPHGFATSVPLRLAGISFHLAGMEDKFSQWCRFQAGASGGLAIAAIVAMLALGVAGWAFGLW